MLRPCVLLLIAASSFTPLASAVDSPTVTTPDGITYHIYAGNTHAHTAFTWSHGEQWVNVKPDPGEKKEPGIFVDADGAQYPAKSSTLKPDWQKVQGPPAVHFALAKEKGYDFYVTTDHTQEAD